MWHFQFGGLAEWNKGERQGRCRPARSLKGWLPPGAAVLADRLRAKVGFLLQTTARVTDALRALCSSLVQQFPRARLCDHRGQFRREIERYQSSFILSHWRLGQIPRAQFGHAHEPPDRGGRSHFGSRDRLEGPQALADCFRTPTPMRRSGQGAGWAIGRRKIGGSSQRPVDFSGRGAGSKLAVQSRDGPRSRRLGGGGAATCPSRGRLSIGGGSQSTDGQRVGRRKRCRNLQGSIAATVSKNAGPKSVQRVAAHRVAE